MRTEVLVPGSTTFDECQADRAECRAELLKRADLQYVSDYERRFMENCMQQKGYRLVSAHDLPLDARRVEPNLATAVPWDHFYGLAGSLPE